MEQKQNKTKTKLIYSKRICEQLMLMGFRPIETIPNPIKPEFICWAFEDTKEFNQALSIVLGGNGNGIS